MSAMRRGWAAVSMMMGLAMLAGCASAPSIAAGGAAKSPMEPPPAPSASPSYGQSTPMREAEVPMQPQVSSRDYRNADKASEEAPRKDRPGLGTEWGETRYSSISRVSFERADFTSPFASLALFYNDQQGANAMASTNRSWANSFAVAGGLVTVDLRDESGSPYRGFVSAGRSFVIGEAGHRYSVVLHNRTDFRFEVVLSVDGLDVMDGKLASFDKRGYILEPHGDLEVDGFRQSVETVAAFRFGSVRNSYAEKKHGDARNVGVIGVALFHERGMPQPVWTPEEVRQRRSANPFPGTFATPPGE
ncbi:MAG: hypothetical protein QM820_21520 [Minicystis sp.]